MPLSRPMDLFEVGDWSWLNFWSSGGSRNPSRTKSTASSSDTRSSTSTRSVPPMSGGMEPVKPPHRSDSLYRVRMMNMEKQLANLSSLVHSALMSKGVSETVYKDLEMLRKEIFGSSGPPSSSGGTRDDASDSGSVSRFSDLSSEKGSYQSNADKGMATYSLALSGHPWCRYCPFQMQTFRRQRNSVH